MKYTFDFGILADNWTALAWGAWSTVQISAVSMVISLLIGVFGILVQQWGWRPVQWAVKAYIEIIRNTPFLVQIFFIFFGLPTLGLRLTPMEGAIVALSLNGGAYTIEVIRGGVQSIKKGQVEAAFVLGLSRLQTFRYVVIRPALRVVYPALCSQFILLMLTSSAVSVISARELTYAAAQIESLYFISFETYAVITLIYLALSILYGVAFKVIGKVYFSYPVK